LNSITVYRAKTGITDHDKVLKKRGELWNTEVRLGKTLFGILYARREALKPPSWFKYFDPPTDLSGLKLRTGGSAAVLVAHRHKVLYAITFGYGRLLLNEEAIEPRFGLRTTLNAVDPTKIRSIDHKRLEAVSRHTREQLSKASKIYDFGLDVERDLLSAATGVPTDPSNGLLLAGRDQLTAIGDIPLKALPSYLDQYEALSNAKTYESSFPWVDNIAEVTDPSARAMLDEKLSALLQSGAIDGLWLAPPEIIDWPDNAGFGYKPHDKGPARADLELTEYLALAQAKGPITSQRLREDRVVAYHADESTGPSWAIHRCVVGEVSSGADTYVLNEGKWYRVRSSFLDTVNSFVESMQALSIPLPAYGHASEGAYNAAAANTSKGTLATMDKVWPKGTPYGQVEVCDLYSKQHHLIHVKRYRDSSGPLSHLFNQGAVSAQLLAHDPQFRKAFYEQVPTDFRRTDPLAPLGSQELEVAFAIVVKKGRPLRLPFFSRVTLRNAVRLVTGLGFRASLSYVGTF